MPAVPSSKPLPPQAGEYQDAPGGILRAAQGVAPEAHRENEAGYSEDGRRRYGQRFATVEPVFGSLRHNKRLNRFTPRGQAEVDTQWKLSCLVHNIEKRARHGYGQ